MSTTTLDAPDQNTVVQPIGDIASSEPTTQIVSFRLGEEEYGFDIMHVQEIILIGELTEMPQVPTEVRGLINLRGHVIPIVDLRVRFGLPITDPTEHSRIIVLNVGKKTIGITVDGVDEVLRISTAQVEPAPRGIAEVKQHYIKGLVKLENRLLILLDATSFGDFDTTSE